MRNNGLFRDTSYLCNHVNRQCAGLAFLLIILGILIVPSSASPDARFEAIPSYGEAPLNVTFVDQSAANATGWNWTAYTDTGKTQILFSDNFTTGNFTDTPPISMVYQFEDPGVYPVDLVAYNATDLSKSSLFSDNVTVVPPVISANFTAVPATGPAPLNVSFVDLSTGNVTSWAWNFGDTSTSVMRNPEHQYANPDNYTVTLTASNSHYGVVDNFSMIVTAGLPLYPDVKFASTPLNGTAPLNVSFIDQSEVDPSNPEGYWYYYDFGDGQVFNDSPRNVDHMYNRSGTFFPSLILTSMENTSHVVWSNATVPVIVSNSTAVANFTAVYRNGTAPLNVSFIDQSYSELPIVEWLWNFGDNFTSTDQNPEHVFANPGEYSVNLTVWDSMGIRDDEEKTNYIIADNGTGPVSSFIPVPAHGQVPLNVTFFDTSEGNVTSWAWSFGDMGTSTEQNPSHVFQNVSVYQVNLTVSDTYGHSSTSSVNVTVLPKDLPQAEFTWLPKNGTAPLNVSFLDQSIIDAGWFPLDVTYLWDFDDPADPDQATGANPVHTYTQGGMYNVTLWLSCGSYANATISKDVTVLNGSAPSTSFVAAPRAGPRPLTVSFIDTSVSEVPLTAWNWSFGDSGANSTEQNPHHMYTVIGTYDVSLTVEDVLGRSGSVEYPGMINVTESDTTIRAGFSAIPSYGNPPLAVSFTDTSEYVGNVSRIWTFGDNSSSEIQNPVHVYATQGDYLVNLTISDGYDQSSNTTVISVWPLQAYFSWEADAQNSLNVSFQDLSTGYPLKWFWTFGDGYTSQVQNATHEYAKAGTYSVALYIQNGANKHATIKQVTVS